MTSAADSRVRRFRVPSRPSSPSWPLSLSDSARNAHKGFVGGEFKLGIIPTVMPTLLPMFLNNFTKKYPKVKLIIEELTTEEIIKKLSDNHLDAGLAATPLEN